MISSLVLGSVPALLFLVASTAAAPTTCSDPEGFQWAVYDNPFATDPSTPSNYPQFNPTVIKSETPRYSGVAGSIGISGPGLAYDYFYPYGYSSDTVYESNFIVDHRGYIKTTVTGFYNFTINADDDIVEFWVGPKAYKGWTRQNSAITYSYYKQPAPPVSKVFRLVKGKHVPFRIIFAQTRGPYNLQATLYDPNGNVLLGQDTSLSESIVQYACNNLLGPPFPPYGSE